MEAGEPIYKALEQAESTGALLLVSLVEHWGNNPNQSEADRTKSQREQDLFVSWLTLTTQPSSSPCASRLHTLDLSRNLFKTLPDWMCGHLVSLTHLNVSRNSLLSLPSNIGNLKHLQQLVAFSNNFRARLLPIDELASMPKLELLDLRYCSKLKESMREMLLLKLSDKVELITTTTTSIVSPKKLSAGERDPMLLRSQLEPLSTPQLRKRLERTFGLCFDVTKEESHNRESLMQTLLSYYDKTLPREGRSVRQERGTPCPPEILIQLKTTLAAIQWPHDRERPKISAERYMILQRSSSSIIAGTGEGEGTCKTKKSKEAAKLEKYSTIWSLAEAAIRQVDAAFADRFTALAITKNFRGSPHIDTLNVGPFYGISFGDFTPTTGGKICVECSALVVAEVDTRERFGKVDGRFPHWVSAYDGTRHSLIYYVTRGEVIPQTTAVFPPKDGFEGASSWVPPEAFVL